MHLPAAKADTSFFGVNTIGDHQWDYNGALLMGTPSSVGVTAYVSSVNAYLYSIGSSQLMKAAIYSDASGSPDVLLASSDNVTVGTSASWVTFPLTYTAAPGTYWLCILTSGNSRWYVYNVATGLILDSAVVYPTFPTPENSGTVYPNQMSIYAVYSTVPPATATPTPSPSPSPSPTASPSPTPTATPQPMGISLIQSNTWTANVRSGTFAGDLTSTPSIGHMLVLGVSAACPVTAISQTGVTWTYVTGINTNDITGWYGTVDSGSAGKTVTLTLGSSSADGELVVVSEWSGLTVTSPVDKTASHVESSEATTSPTGTTAVTSQAYELAVGFMVGWETATDHVAQSNPKNGFELLGGAENNLVHYISAGMLYKVVSQTGAYSSGVDYAGLAWCSGFIMTFKADASTPTPTPGASVVPTPTPSPAPLPSMTPYESNPVITPSVSGWDSYGVGVGDVVWNGSCFEMVYGGSSSFDQTSFDNWNIGLAHSSDGLTWVKDGKVLTVPDGFYSIYPDSLYFDAVAGHYVMFLHLEVPNAQPTNPNDWAIGYANSTGTDLSHWTYGGIILNATQIGVQYTLTNACVIKVESTYYMSASACLSNGVNSIYLLKSSNLLSGYSSLGQIIAPNMWDSKVFIYNNNFCISVHNHADTDYMYFAYNDSTMEGSWSFSPSWFSAASLGGRSAVFVSGSELLDYFDVDTTGHSKIYLAYYNYAVPSSSVSPSPTDVPLSADDAVGIAVAFGVISIGVCVALVFTMKRRNES